MSLNESRAINKKTFINFYPLIGTSTELTEFLTIPNPKHMGSSDGYEFLANGFFPRPKDVENIL